MSTTSKAFWVEFKPYDPDAGEKITVRICTHNHKDATLIDADNGVFLPYMSAFPTLEISAFDGSFSGEASVTVTNIEATNTMGFSKDFTKYVWDGAEVVVYKGDTSATDMVDLSPMFRGVVVETPETSEGVVSWSVQDRKYLLDVDIFTETYSGDGGIDGTAEMEGAAKPVAIGYPLNIEPVLIDPAQLIYQYHGYGPTEGVMGLYENGLSFGPKRSTVAYRTSEAVTYQDLIDADCDAGEWVDCPSIGCFKLGGEPVSGGVISADVGGHLVGGYTAARVDYVLSLLISMAELPADFTDASTFSSIYADSGNQTISDYEVSSFRLSDKITDYMAQLGGYPFVSSTGAMRFGLVRMSTPALEIRTDQTSMPIVEDAKSLSVSAPYKRIRMGGDRVFKVHDNGEVSDALYQAVFALSIEVDQATTDLYVLSDDNVISKSEKIQTAIPNDTLLGRRYVELRARAVDLGIDVTILDSKLQAYVSSRDAMSPSFFDTNNNTTLAANSTWRDDVVELGEELVKTNRLISEEDAKRADWDSVTGTNRPEDNATVGAPGGTNVGGREALELINDVEAQRADIDQHEVSIGNNRVSIDGQQVTLDSHGNRIDDAEADIAVQEGFRVAQQQINIDVDQEISDAKADIDDLVTTYGNTASSAANADAAQIAKDAALVAQGLAEEAEGNAAQANSDAQAAKSASQSARDTAISKASEAGGYATTAENHKNAAAGSASTATAQATVATTKAGEASVSAGQAATSESNAAGSAVSAASSSEVSASNRDAAASHASGNLIRKGTFEDNSPGLWNGTVQGVTGPPGQNYTRAIKALSIDLKEGPFVRGNWNNRKIRVRGWCHRRGSTDVGAGIIGQDASGNPVNNYVFLMTQLAADDWGYFDATVTTGSNFSVATPFVRSANNGYDGPLFVGLVFEDITESTAAAGEASAAATSASLASTKATEASQSASSATTSANTASTKAGEASTSAGQAATSASSAAGSATSASTFSTLSAKSSEQSAVHAGGNLIPKPTFEDADKGPWSAVGAIQGVQGPSGQNYNYAIRNTGTDLTAHPYKRGNWKNRTFRFRGWAYRPNGTAGAGVGILGKVPSGSVVNNSYVIDAQLPVNTWAYFDQEITTTHDYETAAPFVRSSSPYGVLWVDVICEDITEQKAAAGSASAAASSATTASVKAGEASTSASQAQTSANTATTKAGEANTSATNASVSATTASTAASTATTQAGIAASFSELAGSPVALTQNGGFGAGLSGLVNNYQGNGTIAPDFTPAIVDGRNAISSNAPGQRKDLGNVSGYVPVVAGRRIRTTLTAKVTGTGSTRLFAMLVSHDASKAFVAHYSTAPYYTAADGWKTVTAERTLDGSEGAFLRVGAITNYDAVSGITGVHIDELYIEDITESYEAEQSASAAVTSAENAAASASGASTSATSAQTSANTATTKAGEASSSATAAAGSATSAGSSASAASGSATLAANYQGYAASHAEGNLIPKPTFEDGNMGPWTGGFLQAVSGPSGGNYSRAIRNGGVDMLAHARRKGNWSNRTFRCRGWLNRPSGTSDPGVGIIGNVDGGSGAADYVNLESIAPVNTWVYFDVEVTTRSGYYQAAPFVRSGANYGCYWIDVVVEDITEQKAAAAQAAIATSQAVIATAEAAAAKSTSELTARLNTGAINPNPGFLDYPSTAAHPTGWETWLANGTTRSTASGVGKALPRLTATSPSYNSGMVMRAASTPALTFINAGAKYVLELDARAIAGTSWKGFALGVWWLDASGAYINNETIAPSRDTMPQGGIAPFDLSYIHSWSKLVTAPANARKCDLYLFGNYNNSTTDAPYPSGTRTVEVHRAVLRPATAEEVRSNSVIPALEASVAVNQGAIVDLENAAAFFEVLVAASGGNPAIVRMLAGKNGSAIDMVSDVLRIRNSVNGNLVDVATFEGGIARLNAALIRDLAVAPTPTSEIYHRVQLEPLRLTGSHNQVIQYQGGSAYSKAPNISRDTTGEVLPALPAGEAYDIRPIEITSSQFKIRAVKLVAGESVAQTSSAGSNTGGTPSWRTNKPSSANAHDGDYTFTFVVTLTKVSEFVDNEFGTARTISRYEGSVTLYGLVGSTWTALKSFTIIRSYQTTGPGSHPATKSYGHNETVNSGSNFGSGSNRFGIHAGTNATITSFTKVTYNTQTTSSEVALTGNFKFIVSPPTE